MIRQEHICSDSSSNRDITHHTTSAYIHQINILIELQLEAVTSQS